MRILTHVLVGVLVGAGFGLVFYALSLLVAPVVLNFLSHLPQELVALVAICSLLGAVAAYWNST